MVTLAESASLSKKESPEKKFFEEFQVASWKDEGEGTAGAKGYYSPPEEPFDFNSQGIDVVTSMLESKHGVSNQTTQQVRDHISNTLTSNGSLAGMITNMFSLTPETDSLIFDPSKRKQMDIEKEKQTELNLSHSIREIIGSEKPLKELLPENVFRQVATFT